MKLHLSQVLYFAVFLLSLTAMKASAKFIAVNDGKADSIIIIAPDASEDLKNTAKYFQTILEEISGAAIPIKSEKSQDKPIQLIEDLALENEEFSIQIDQKSITIYGGGRFGVLYGINELLYRLGMYWPLPDPLWREVPKLKTVEFEAVSLHSKPYFQIRAIHHHPPATESNAFFNWMSFNRSNYRLQNPPGNYNLSAMNKRGVKPFFISHSWAFWATRKALNEHPEWNPLLQNKRTPPALEGNPWWSHSQLCIGNPELRKFMYNQMLKYLEENPAMDTLSLESNDGRGYCDCEICQAYGKDNNERVFKFCAEAAEIVGQKFPKVTLLILSYGPHKEVPAFKMPDNLIFGVVYNNRNYARPLTDPSNAEYLERLTEWAKAYPGRVYIYELWTKTFFRGYPSPFDRVFSEDIKLYRDLKLGGLCPEGIHPSPTTEFLRSRLSWDPDSNPQELLAELCQGLYGNAAEYMLEFYDIMEEASWETATPLGDLTVIGKFISKSSEAAFMALEKALASTAEGSQQRARILSEQANFQRLYDCSTAWRPCSQDMVTEAMRTENCLPNGSFENDFESWNKSILPNHGEFDFEIVKEDTYHGAKYATISPLQAGPNGLWGRICTSVTGLNPDKLYSLYAAVKTTDGADMASIWYMPEGLSAMLFRLGPTGGEWYRAAFHDIPAPNGIINIYLTIHTNPKQGKVAFDDVIIVEQK